MKIVAVSMVKNESDIIEHTIDNLFRQGVDEMIIADNMSDDYNTDGVSTTTILEDLEHCYPIELRRDTEVGYFQSDKMTRMALDAFRNGADVVIPFDADECWRVAEGDFKALFEKYTGDVIHFHLFNYFPTSGDSDAMNPFLRIRNRDSVPAPLHKVAVRAFPGVKILQGNHGASGNGSHVVVPVEDGFIGHFPWRSAEQFVSKAVNGAAAYAATDLPEDVGGHWRGYGRIYAESGTQGLVDHYETWFEDPEEVSLVEDPILGTFL